MSDKKLAIKLSTLEDIGNALREKEKSTEPIPVNVLADRILALPVASGESKFTQLVKRSITEVTEKDLEGVTTIGDSVFHNCANLINVAIPEGIIGIDKSAFYGCTKLVKLKLPVSLTYIDRDAFYYQSPIEETHYPGESWQWCKISRRSSIVGNLYLKNQLFEHLVLESTPEAYQGFYDVTYIEPYSFNECKSLKTVTIKGASNRYSFHSSMYGNSGQSYAFSSCENLVSVEIGTKKFGSGSSLDTSLPSNIFNNCPNLTDIYVCWSEGEIGNAPWGATNATIHYNTPIRFYIGDTEYRGLVDMTFEEWVNSKYNTGGFYVNENGYVQNVDGLFVKHTQHFTDSSPFIKTAGSNKIAERYKFSLEA